MKSASQFARSYWVTDGLVTGGPYNSHQGCQPYLMKPCDHHVVGRTPGNIMLCSTDCLKPLTHAGKLQPCPKVAEETPKCSVECEAGYSVPYKKDKHYGMSHHSIITMQSIQTEIMTNGPVEATMRVYSDFLQYKSGTNPFAMEY